MATKKITVNELKSLVKQIMTESKSITKNTKSLKESKNSTTKKVTSNGLTSLVKQIIKEENENISSNDPTKEEMLNFLKKRFKGLIDPKDSEFDMEQAIYYFAREHYDGQWSNLYSVFSTSDYRPSRLHNDINDTEDEQSIMMYDALVDRFGN